MNPNPLLERLAALLSRKFLAALAAQIVADAIVKVGGLIALVLAAIGYGAVEASVDRAAVGDVPVEPPPPPTVEPKPGGLTHLDTRPRPGG